jgi:hypothetical protein
MSLCSYTLLKSVACGHKKTPVDVCLAGFSEGSALPSKVWKAS